MELSEYYERYIPPFPSESSGHQTQATLGSKPRIVKLRGNKNDENLQDYRNKMENEALKLWLRMRREAIRDLRSSGYNVD